MIANRTITAIVCTGLVLGGRASALAQPVGAAEAVFAAGGDCGSCRLHGDLGEPFCLFCIEDLLASLDAFDGFFDPNLADVYPCDGSCGTGVVDLDDWLSELAAFSGFSDCPHPCPPGACCGSFPGDPPGLECRDQFFIPNGMSESDCFVIGGVYCGDNTQCGDPCPGGSCPAFSIKQAAQPDRGRRPGGLWLSATSLEETRQTLEQYFDRAGTRRANGLTQVAVEAMTPGLTSSGDSPVALSCMSLQGTQVIGGQSVDVECFVTTDGTQSFQGIQLDFPCSLPGGAAGALAALEIFVEANHSPPFLFIPNGIRQTSQSRCAALLSIGVGHSPITPSAGMYYLATIRYDVSDCAAGTFFLVFEDASMVPHLCDQTKLRDGARNLIPFDFVPVTFNVIGQRPYGDLVRSGVVDIGDLLCALNGFSNAALCPGGDIAPCGGDGVQDVGDLLAVLDAFAGVFACPGPCAAP